MKISKNLDEIFLNTNDFKEDYLKHIHLHKITAVAGTLMGSGRGGVYSYIMFCTTSFFPNQIPN